MALQGTDVADLVVTSLNQLGRGKFTDIMSDYQNTIALKRLMKKGKMTFEGGPEVQFNLITNTNGSARAVGLGYTTVADMPNVMTTGKVPWRHVTWNWVMERRLVAMNAGAQKIVDIVKTQRVAAMGDAVKMFERFFWRVPDATDTVTPFGLPYYIVKSTTATTTNDGFNGTVPSGYTTVANISPTTYPRWSNYATGYTAVSKDDLIRKLRRAAKYTDFTPLVDDIPQYTLGNDYGWYSNYSVVGTMEEILEAQNENLGMDVAPMDGKVMIRRAPLTFVKELDLDTTNPVYGVNWSSLGTMGLKGEWMREKVFDENPNQPTMMLTNTDCSYNLICYDRRLNCVLATATTMGY